MPTILLVDDEPDLLLMLSTLLNLHGYSVVTASDGVAALQVIGAQTVDLVISDVMMPRMDGLALCGRLRAKPHTRHIPVILNSAGAEEPDGRGALFEVFLRKPAVFEQQLGEIRRLLAAASRRMT